MTRRSSQVIVRLTPTEKAELKQAARDARMSVSDYCRCCMFSKRDDIVGELGRLRAIADRAVDQAQAADRRAMRALTIKE